MEATEILRWPKILTIHVRARLATMRWAQFARPANHNVFAVKLHPVTARSAGDPIDRMHRVAPAWRGTTMLVRKAVLSAITLA